MKDYNGFSAAQRTRAGAWLRERWAEGLPRPSKCDACGQTKGVLDAHAEDYSEPFGPHVYAFSLCFWCHMMIHRRFKAPDAWNAYRTLIRNGWVHDPQHVRSFPAIDSFCNGFNPPSGSKVVGFKLIGEFKDKTVLDLIDEGAFSGRDGRR